MLVSHEDNKSSRGSIDGPFVHVVVSPMSCVLRLFSLDLSPPRNVTSDGMKVDEKSAMLSG